VASDEYQSDGLQLSSNDFELSANDFELSCNDLLDLTHLTTILCGICKDSDSDSIDSVDSIPEPTSSLKINTTHKVRKEILFKRDAMILHNSTGSVVKGITWNNKDKHDGTSKKTVKETEKILNVNPININPSIIRRTWK
jgi:hypothetical protein